MEKDKRAYNKKSPYWENIASKKADQALAAFNMEQSFEPSLEGEPFYISSASFVTTQANYDRGSSEASRSGSRRNRAAYAKSDDRFSSIRNGLLPYDYSIDGVNVREAIELCQKAYANVAVFRNSIDIMSEFANSDIYLEGGSKKSRDFFTQWLNKIKVWNLKDQYFREYYRSGNIFLYRVDAAIQNEEYINLIKILSEVKATSNKIPIK
jgi:hypothetical protein